MNAVMTARELRQRIAAKFGREQRWNDAVTTSPHIVLFEVPFLGRIRPGYTESRSRQRIDVVAVGVWGKTGHLVHGFEVKVARSDLLLELRDLSKSEFAVDAVDRWWLVLAPGIRRDDDPIPESWGILEANGRGLRMIREAAPQAGNVHAITTGLVTRAIVHPTAGRATIRRAGWQEGVEYGATYGRLR